MIDAAIDAEYRVAPSPALLMQARQRAESMSQAARERLPSRLGIPFGTSADEYVDIFPAAGECAPAFVFFHGGFWRAQSARDYSYVALGPAAAGITTVSVNYSLAPVVGIDAIVRQARAALEWLVLHATQQGIDAQRIVVGGHSAGAQLAAMVLLGDRAGILKGALLVSGLYELAPLQHTFVQADLQFDVASIDRNSPMHHVRHVPGQVLLSVGENESLSFRQQSSDFHRALLESGVMADFELVEGADHFAALEPLSVADSAVCRWLRQVIT